MRPHPFQYQRVSSLEEADRALSSAGTVAIGGGTDLIVQVQEGLATPDEVVDLRRIVGNDQVETVGDELRIGGAARIADIARDADVLGNYPMLAEACRAVGTPALREMGTLGGNLCQRPRCWYFRRAIPCLKNGGTDCPARDGENQYHAILGGDPCFIVHPSDPAVALVALEATIEIRSTSGARDVAAADFWVLPSERLDHETVLADGEYVAGVRLPASSRGGLQRYTKLMQRGAWDFALASLAAHRRDDGEVRLVLGGVAPAPWRVSSSIEEDVASGGIDDDAASALATRALHDARPLSKNGYKVQLAETLLKRAMLELGA